MFMKPRTWGAWFLEPLTRGFTSTNILSRSLLPETMPLIGFTPRNHRYKEFTSRNNALFLETMHIGVHTSRNHVQKGVITKNNAQGSMGSLPGTMP